MRGRPDQTDDLLWRLPLPALLCLPSSMNIARCGFSRYSSQILEPKRTCLLYLLRGSVHKRHVNSRRHRREFPISTRPQTLSTIPLPSMHCLLSDPPRSQPRGALLPFPYTTNYVWVLFQSSSKQAAPYPRIPGQEGYTRCFARYMNAQYTDVTANCVWVLPQLHA